MQVKTLAHSLFVLCKLAYFDSASHDRAASHITSKFCTNQEDTCFYVILKFQLNSFDNTEDKRS